MANFFDRYRDSINFRKANNGDGVAYQRISLRKRNENGRGFDERTLLLAVPSFSESSYDTYEELPINGASSSEREKVYSNNMNRQDVSINDARRNVGFPTRGNSGIGTIFGAIDLSSGMSLTSEATKDLLSSLGNNGYFISEVQEPLLSVTRNDGYYPGDVIKKVLGEAPNRGTVKTYFPSGPNTPNEKILNNIRKYGNPFQGK